MTPQEQRKIEQKSNFRIFLYKFWIKTFTEYQGLTQKEKEITLKEYLKRLKSRK